MSASNEPLSRRPLDLICLGRAAVDLYAEQIGARLEDAQTFARYLGGSPANTAVGAARLGLRVAMVSRVGDEHNGRFVRESLEAEGVDVSRVSCDPDRLTALVFLGIKDEDTFPLLFYRRDCADMAIPPDCVDEDFIGSAKALLISGTHLSNQATRETCLKAMRMARQRGTRVVLDIDYRPVLWGLAPTDLGERRYVASTLVTERLREALSLCDLVVGTEEEVLIAGGGDEVGDALRGIRRATQALIVMKRGPMGCVAYAGPIPADLDEGEVGPGFPVEVFNVLGAGDAFMAGLLRGWVLDEPLSSSLRYANACGAIVVSRHGCAPAMPSWTELRWYLDFGSTHRRLREDDALERLHRSTLRKPVWSNLAVLAFDHRSQLEETARRHGASAERIARFKGLVARAAEHGHALETAEQSGAPSGDASGLPRLGVIVDDRYGRAELNRLSGRGIWMARPVELPGSRPLAFESGDRLGLDMRTWPGEQVAKCLVFLHPDDEPGLMQRQLAAIQALANACKASSHELLLEVIAPRDLPGDDSTMARAVNRIYQAGVFPDWWKLPPPSVQGWGQLEQTIVQHDPHCRGVLLLGLEATEQQLIESFKASAGQSLCKGFAIGRTLFAHAATSWFAGDFDDSDVIADVALRYRRLIRLWRECRNNASVPTSHDEPIAIHQLT